jgi:hypothetical protein
MRRTGTLTTVLALAALSTTTALAQPVQQDSPPPPPPPTESESFTPDRDQLKARLERAIEANKKAQADLESSLASLKSGADPAEVRRGLNAQLIRALLVPPLSREQRESMRRPRPAGGPAGREQPGPSSGPPSGPPSGPQSGEPEVDPRAARQEQRMIAQEVLKEALPDLHERLQRVREADGQMYDRVLLRNAPRLRELRELRETDPEMFQVKAEELRTGVQIMFAFRERQIAVRLADDTPNVGERREKERKSLEDAIGRNFDQRIKVQELEAQRLTERVESVRADIERRKSERDTAIKEIADRMDREGLKRSE